MKRAEVYVLEFVFVLQFEVARCRPLLTADFFKQLDTLVGQERFSAKPDEERLAELETLRQVVEPCTMCE